MAENPNFNLNCLNAAPAILRGPHQNFPSESLEVGCQRIIDEETPLLEDQSRNHPLAKKTPLPWRQFSIILLLQVSEPVTSQVIAPFLPQLIKDIGVTDGKDSRIGYYVGLMHSLFFLTEACTIFHWSRMSDQVGRRPVLLTGLFGLSASMWCFGLSKTFWGLVVSRCLNGALNGNVGVIRSTIMEITDSTNVAQAYSIIPIVWSFGATLGPLIGGSFAKPTERFPMIFGDSAFFKRYPYFLPCSISAIFTAISWIIAFLCLKETTKPLMTPWQYLSGGPTKSDKPRPDSEVDEVLHDGPAPDKQLPLRALLIRPVLVAAGSYATIALIDIAFRTVIPVFYAMPIRMGGLNLNPPTIGIILALLGISNGIIQWSFFTLMHDWLGPKTFFLVSVSFCIPMIALFPAINAAARTYGLGYFVWFLVGLQLTFFIFASSAFALSFIFVSAAAPNKASIGATNGIAQVIVSLMRAVGPATVNSAYSLSIEEHVMGGNFVYWVMVTMVGLAIWVGYLLPRNS